MIKEKLLRADILGRNPEFAQTVDAQLAGTWRPAGSKKPKYVGDVGPDSHNFYFPVSGYQGHRPTWRRKLPEPVEAVYDHNGQRVERPATVAVTMPVTMPLTSPPVPAYGSPAQSGGRPGTGVVTPSASQKSKVSSRALGLDPTAAGLMARCASAPSTTLPDAFPTDPRERRLQILYAKACEGDGPQPRPLQRRSGKSR